MFGEEEQQKDNKLTEDTDYPKMYREFITMFPDEKNCRDFLFQLK